MIFGFKYTCACKAFQVALESGDKIKYKNLSYRRNSVRRRSLRHSRSFKVIYIDTNRKTVCDFLLLDNTNLHPISHRLPISRPIDQIIAFDKGMSVVTALAISANIAINHMLLKTRFF